MKRLITTLIIITSLCLTSFSQLVLEYDIDEENYILHLPFSQKHTVSIDWGDGSPVQKVTGSMRGPKHTYKTTGIRTVKVTGELLQFGNSYVSRGNEKLVKIIKWDLPSLISLKYAGYTAEKLISVPDHLPKNVTDISSMFYKAEIFNGDISGWNTSQITTMSYLFRSAKKFNQPLNKWDLSNVTSTYGMFNRAYDFNQSLNKWNVSNVKYMGSMFESAGSFNQDINNWDVSMVETMKLMFNRAKKFNQPLDKWNVSSVKDMESMFSNTGEFNQNINSWDVSKVENMKKLFYWTSKFNQPLDKWNVSNVINMEGTFMRAFSFNQSLGKWNLASVQIMKDFFSICSIDASNYSETLKGWSKNETTAKNISINGASNSKTKLEYCKSALKARTTLEAKGWSFSSDSMSEDCK